MRVFHFRTKEYAIQSIRERRLKIARIEELNDPFEFLGVRLDDRGFRVAMKSMKREISMTRGLICFSKSWGNPLQWSHYAEDHKGICLGFDVPRNLLAKVNYVNSRLRHDGLITLPVMEKILKTKFRHWQYEKEYRLFIGLDKFEEENGLFFLGFSHQLKLKQVIVGSRSNVSRSEIAAALGNFKDEVEVFRTRPAFKTYKIVRNENEKLWA
jgi:hypothetical protein